MGLNKWIGIGRLTRDPELKVMQSGKTVTRFSMAVNRPYKRGGSQEADFFNVEAWEKKGEFVHEYFRKGDPIQVIGRIEFNKYQDRDGVERIATNVIAETVDFVEGYKRDDAQRAPATNPAYETQQPEYSEDDDLPF